MASQCDKQYDYWGYFWVALLVALATVLFVRSYHDIGTTKAQLAVASDRPSVAPIQIVTQNAAPINITVTAAPPAPVVTTRTTVVNRYVKPKYYAKPKAAPRPRKRAKPVHRSRWTDVCYECTRRRIYR